MKIVIEVPNDIWDMLTEMADNLHVDPAKVLQQEMDELLKDIEAWVERGIMLAQQRQDSNVPSEST